MPGVVFLGILRSPVRLPILPANVHVLPRSRLVIAFALFLGAATRATAADGVLSAQEWEVVLLSLRVAAVSVLLSLPLAIGVAYVLARRQFPGKTALDAAVHLPLVLPPVVVGFALLALFGRQGPLGRFFADTFGIVFAFRWTGAALASAVMGFPLMVRAIRLSLEAIDPRLETAARTLGASSPWIFASVTLPLAVPGIVTGVLLSFARGLGEFGATITFVSNIPGETETLPLAIYSLTQSPGGDAQALKLSLVAVVLSAVALAVSQWLTARHGRRTEP